MTTPRHRRRMVVSVLGSRCPAFWNREGNKGYQGRLGGRCVRKGLVVSDVRKDLILFGDVGVGETSIFGEETGDVR